MNSTQKAGIAIIKFGLAGCIIMWMVGCAFVAAVA